MLRARPFTPLAPLSLGTLPACPRSLVAAGSRTVFGTFQRANDTPEPWCALAAFSRPDVAAFVPTTLVARAVTVLPPVPYFTPPAAPIGRVEGHTVSRLVAVFPPQARGTGLARTSVAITLPAVD